MVGNIIVHEGTISVCVQVRTNAALALGSPASYAQLCEVWGAVVEGLEGSEHQEDFSEYRHASSLRTQVSGRVTL